jgi:hypothetical protein
MKDNTSGPTANSQRNQALNKHQLGDDPTHTLETCTAKKDAMLVAHHTKIAPW